MATHSSKALLSDDLLPKDLLSGALAACLQAGLLAGLLAGLMLLPGCVSSGTSAMPTAEPQDYAATPQAEPAPLPAPVPAPAPLPAPNPAGSVHQPAQLPALEQPAPAPAPAHAPDPASGQAAKLRPYWDDLRLRLAKDGLSGPKVDALLATLGERTQSPMGRKMRQLYTSKFLPKPKPEDVPMYYKGVLTEANAQKCRNYLKAHKGAFDRAEAAFGVPREIAVSLLFVETRLGDVLGDVKENAFQTLASMAESRRFEDIPDWHAKMPGCEQHRDWFDETMPKRADWAYNETRALVKYMLKSGLAPGRFPGSIYGAIGLCQFMPSNIETYGADGSGDGVIDLFDIQDAAMSLSRYLARHGWKPGIARAQQHKCLMAYNHAEIYANTILALSDMVKAQPKPASAKQAAPKQTAPKQAAPKPAKPGKAKLI